MKKLSFIHSKGDAVIIFITSVSLVVILSFGLNAGVAMLIGLAIGLIFEPSFSEISHRISPKMLKSAIVLIGFGVELSLIKDTAGSATLLIGGVVAGAFALGFVLTKLFRIENCTGTLISTGSAICGGSAIAAASQAMRAPKQAITVSLTVIFLLNLVGLYAFPAIGAWLELSQREFGLWSALAIHDTSSVLGAAAIYGEEALEIATSTKLLRALCIIPLIFILGFFYNRGTSRFSIPLFIFLFFAASASKLVIDASAAFAILYQVGRIGLVIALFTLGLSITRSTLAQLSLRPLMMASVLWIFISALSLLMIKLWY